MYLRSPTLATIKVRLGMMLQCRRFQSISIANRDKKLNRKPIRIRNSRVTLEQSVVEKKSHAGFSVLFSFILLPLFCCSHSSSLFVQLGLLLVHLVLTSD